MKYNTQKGVVIKYTNSTGADMVSGQIIDVGGRCGIVIADIDNGDTGSVMVQGIVAIPKKAEVMNAGLPFGWDDDGNSVSGTAGAGAATLLLADADVVGGCVALPAVATDSVVYVALNEFSPKYPYYPDRTYVTKSDNYTILVTDTAKVIQIATDAKTLTLSAVSGITGCDVIVQNMGGDGVAAVTLSPGADDKIVGPGIAGTNNKDLINTKATANQGDRVRVIAGTDWFVKELVGTWATEE